MGNLILEITEQDAWAIHLSIKSDSSEKCLMAHIPKVLSEEELFDVLVNIKSGVVKIRAGEIENRELTASEIAIRKAELNRKFEEYIDNCEKLNDLLEGDILTSPIVTNTVANLWNNLNEWRIDNDYTDKEFEAEKWVMIHENENKQTGKINEI